MMDDGQWIMDDELSLPMGEFIFHSPCSNLSLPSMSLQIATLAWSTLSTMVAGDTSQTTPVKIIHVFVLCCFAQIEHMQFWFL